MSNVRTYKKYVEGVVQMSEVEQVEDERQLLLNRSCAQPQHVTRVQARELAQPLHTLTIALAVQKPECRLATYLTYLT